MRDEELSDLRTFPPSDQPRIGVHAAICGVILDLCKEGIGKNRRNTQQGYQFRGVDDVYNALAPLLAKHRLTIVPDVVERLVTERQSKQGGALFSVVVRVDYSIVCADDGSETIATVYGEAMDSADKATNKAMSAAYKYMAIQTFCIPTESSEDADTVTHEVAPRREEKPSPAFPVQLDQMTIVAGITEASTLAELEEWARQAAGLNQAEKKEARAAYAARLAALKADGELAAAERSAVERDT